MLNFASKPSGLSDCSAETFSKNTTGKKTGKNAFKINLAILKAILKEKHLGRD